MFPSVTVARNGERQRSRSDRLTGVGPRQAFPFPLIDIVTQQDATVGCGQARRTGGQFEGCRARGADVESAVFETFGSTASLDLGAWAKSPTPALADFSSTGSMSRVGGRMIDILRSGRHGSVQFLVGRRGNDDLGRRRFAGCRQAE